MPLMLSIASHYRGAAHLTTADSAHRTAVKCIVLPTTLLPNRLEAAPVLHMPTKKPGYTACAYVPPQMQHTLLQPAHQPIEPFAAPPQPWAPVFCRLRAK